MLTKSDSGDSVYRLQTEFVVLRPIAAVFTFFSDAFQLEAITPPSLNLRVVTPPPIEISTGTEIEYRLRVHGVSMHWRSLITVWEPPYRLVDEQVSGPYRFWRHELRFAEARGGTLVEDVVRYRVRGGDIVNRLFVTPNLNRIFRYREEALKRIFS